MHLKGMARKSRSSSIFCRRTAFRGEHPPPPPRGHVIYVSTQRNHDQTHRLKWSSDLLAKRHQIVWKLGVERLMTTINVEVKPVNA